MLDGNSRRQAGKHSNSLNRIVQTYMGGPGLIAALEIYVENQCEQAKVEGEGRAASAVCLGLHASQPDQILCARCVEAEAGVGELIKVQEELNRPPA